MSKTITLTLTDGAIETLKYGVHLHKDTLIEDLKNGRDVEYKATMEKMLEECFNILEQIKAQTTN